MVRRIKIGSFRASFVLRHRWEKDSDSMIINYEANNIRKNWQLGIWVKKYEVVGKVRLPENVWVKDEVVKETFSDKNLVNNYMIGLNLIVCKVWVDFTFKPTFEIKIK
jgi:hypothetical protein